MAETSLSLPRDVESLILEQILAFKQSTGMSDQDILKFHQRHQQIMEFYRQARGGPGKGWLS